MCPQNAAIFRHFALASWQTKTGKKKQGTPACCCYHLFLRHAKNLQCLEEKTKTHLQSTSSSSMRINTLRVVCKMLSYEQIIDNVWWHFTRTNTDNVHHKHWSLLYIWQVWVLQLPSSPSRRSKTGSQNWWKKLIQNWITKYFHDNRFEKPALLLIPFLKRYTFIKHQVWSHV